MNKLDPIRKAIAAVVVGVPAWGAAAQEGGIDPAELWGLAAVLGSAFLIWLVPNDPPS